MTKKYTPICLLDGIGLVNMAKITKKASTIVNLTQMSQILFNKTYFTERTFLLKVKEIE
jgi:hypothetical protein